MSGAEIWRSGVMQYLLSSCKPRHGAEAEMSPAKRSLCSCGRMVYLRGDQHTEKLMYLTR